MRSTRVAFALAAGLLTSVASAQTITGTVRSERDGAPIPGAIVILMRDSAKVTATLTGDDGTFRLQAPSPGAYAVRVDVVGYRSAAVPTFEVGPSSSTVRDVRFPFERVALPAVAITASSTCSRVAGENGDAAQLWNEARKGLEATRIAQDERRFAVTLTRYERVLSFPDSVVKSSQSSTQSGVSENPFVSLSPDSIAAVGFRVPRAGRDHYFAPDARVLLSDNFVAAHCFGTRRGGPPGTLGLSFRPQRVTKNVDVEGVLWLDSATAELRTLEYRYTPGTRQASAGGTVEFGRLPNGVRGVRRWAIRMPVLEVHESRTRPDGALGRFVDTLVTSVQVEGGEVIAGVAAAAAGGGTRLRGIIFDSTRNAVVANAVVTLEGAGLTVRSGADGGFQFDSLRDAGSFRIRFWHPRLDSLGIAMPRTVVQVRRGEENTASLAIPGPAAIARERCGETVTSPVHVLTGVVRARGDAIADLPVLALQWGSHAGSSADDARLQVVSTTSRENGRFAFCQLLPAAPIWLVARVEDVWTNPMTVSDDASATAVDFQVADTTALLQRVDASSPKVRVAAQLARVRIPGDETRMEGIVLLNDDATIGPAQVFVDGKVVTTTTPSGTFMVQRIPEGKHQIIFRAAGYAPVSVAANLQHGEEPILLITPQRTAAQSIASSARRGTLGSPWLAGFQERRAYGEGYFFDRATIERKGAKTLADIVRGVPGLRIVPNPEGYKYEARGTPPRLFTQIDTATSRITKMKAETCQMMFFVDGQPFAVETGAIDDHVRPDFLEAVEVYTSPSSVPRQFAGNGSACGVMVLWTRTGG